MENKKYTFKVENKRIEVLEVIASSEEEARQKLEDLEGVVFKEGFEEDDYYLDEAELYEIEEVE